MKLTQWRRQVKPAVRGTPLDLPSFRFLSLFSLSLSIHYCLSSSATYLLVVLVLTVIIMVTVMSCDVVDSRLQNLWVLQAGIILSIGPTFPLTPVLLPTWS
jgi:hypothetical protein